MSHLQGTSSRDAIRDAIREKREMYKKVEKCTYTYYQFLIIYMLSILINCYIIFISIQAGFIDVEKIGRRTNGFSCRFTTYGNN